MVEVRKEDFSRFAANISQEKTVWFAGKQLPERLLHDAVHDASLFGPPSPEDRAA